MDKKTAKDTVFSGKSKIKFVSEYPSVMGVVNVTDDSLKLIVKISEGSVRDALSLLDRGLISNIDNEELDLKKAQKIYGYFDKSSLIELFENLFKGDEDNVVKLY